MVQFLSDLAAQVCLAPHRVWGLRFRVWRLFRDPQTSAELDKGLGFRVYIGFPVSLGEGVGALEKSGTVLVD